MYNRGALYHVTELKRFGLKYPRKQIALKKIYAK